MDKHSPSIRLPLGWEYLEPDEAAWRLAELKRELPADHLLFGTPVETFAARIGDDDTLFHHLDEPDRFSVVHLTWLGREEINGRHPCVEFDGTLAAFLAREQRIVEGLAMRPRPGSASAGGLRRQARQDDPMEENQKARSLFERFADSGSKHAFRLRTGREFLGWVLGIRADAVLANWAPSPFEMSPPEEWIRFADIELASLEYWDDADDHWVRFQDV